MTDDPPTHLPPTELGVELPDVENLQFLRRGDVEADSWSESPPQMKREKRGE